MNKITSATDNWLSNSQVGLGSRASSMLNSAAGGVDGMPLTHQVGFGEVFGHFQNPASVNLQQMEDHVHEDLIETAALAGLTVLAVKLDQPFLALVGAFATGCKIAKHKRDWVNGFPAAEIVRAQRPEYFEKYPPLKNKYIPSPRLYNF